MSITFDNASNGTTIGSGTNISWSETVGSITNGILIVLAVATVTISGVTLNSSVNLLQFGSTLMITGGQQGSLWYLLNPPSGLNTMKISTGSTGGIAGAGVSFANVAQSGTFGTLATNFGTSTTPSNIVATTSLSQVVIDCIFDQSSSSEAATTGQTIRANNGWDLDIGSIVATGSNMTLGWTVSTSSNWGEMSVALNPFVPASPLYAPLVVPGAVVGPSIWQGPPGLKYPSKMGPVIRRANGIFRGGGGLMGKNILRRKWWQVL